MCAAIRHFPRKMNNVALCHMFMRPGRIEPIRDATQYDCVHNVTSSYVCKKPSFFAQEALLLCAICYGACPHNIYITTNLRRVYGRIHLSWYHRVFCEVRCL